MLEAKSVCKFFPSNLGGKKQIEAVKDVNLRLNHGVFYALVGESGSGKSTLSLLLTGLIPPTSGDILLDGKSVIPKRQYRRKDLCTQLQLVLQDGKSALDPRFSVYQSIAEPLQNLMKYTKAQEKEIVGRLLQDVELPIEYMNRRASELSGGEQKRVCIARALAVKPDVIIFDEAMSGLDVLVRKSILDLLKRLHREQKATYLMITHDIDVAMYVATNIFIMKNGMIVEQCDYAGNQDCFQHSYTRQLLHAALL